MAAPHTDDDNSNAPTKLWAARIAREKRAAAHYAKTIRRPNVPVTLVTALLRATGLYGRGVRNAADIAINHVTLRYPALPDALAGFRVLHLSDFHFKKDANTDRLCDILRGVECDLCVMTGDFAHTARRSHEYLTAIMGPVAAGIRARHGIYGVLGNHDHSEDVPRLSAVGIKTLVNEGLSLKAGGATVWLAGVDDPHDFGTHDLSRSLQGAPADAFKIVLAHSPELAEEAAERHADLYLCGHTHGGQLSLPWGPPFLNIRCRRKYGWGTWRIGAMYGITTSGLGATAIPVRYWCPPEVVLIELAK